MLFALGFLCAALLALAAVPALARRADRLARKRAEAAFPLSLAEIAADLEARDARDRSRAEAPLVAASDAVLLDTSDLGRDAAIAAAIQIAAQVRQAG